MTYGNPRKFTDTSRVDFGKEKEKRPEFEVLIDGKWRRCKKAKLSEDGWLKYTLADGTTGIKHPDQWRFKMAG